VSAPSSHNPHWNAHLERLRRLSGASTTPARRASADDGEAEEARRGEWTAAPPGRLGRRLLADVEPYLVFFAIARGG